MPIQTPVPSLIQAAAIRNLKPLLWIPLGLAALGLLLHIAWVSGFGQGEIDDFVTLWVYHGVLGLAAVVCLVRAIEPTPERRIWLAFGLGLAAWMAGDVYWVTELALLKNAPYPSWADLGYLIAYPFFYVGVLLLIRRQVRFSAGAWLDGAIGGLAGAALATAVLTPALVGLTKGDTSVVATNLAYPVGDVLLLAFLIAGFTVAGLRVGRSWLLIGLGIAVWGVADGIFLYQTATGTYENGVFLDSLWLIGGVSIAAAAALAKTKTRERRESHSILFPTVFTAIAVGVLTWDHYDRLSELSIWLAVATLVAVVLRLVLSFRENGTLLAAVRHDAVTDALTGLDNRRSLMTHLTRAAEGSREVVLAIFDLDGFKAYNDSFGHPAGDLLLHRLGRHLATAVAPQGRAFRLGGDEFCVLIPGGQERVDSVLAIAGAALSEKGKGFRITASSGAAVLPHEAADPTEALRIADTRMYQVKGQRSSSAQSQTHDVLVRVLREGEPDLGEHLRGVARLAAETGRAAKLDSEDLDSLVRAAELHDIGKIAIPDKILHAPRPLDGAEWELMRTHTTIGERILAAAPAMKPVSKLVRSSHERWDGSGYPDGLAGEAIPLGSRIIFVCDAFEAMTEERSYRDPLSPQEALAELRRCAGTQFDARLVDLFAEHAFPAIGGSPAVNGQPAGVLRG
jgi:two-component system cell cycle response regulator